VTGIEPSTKRMLILAASAFGVLAAEPLFLLTDTAVVGHLGSHPLAALGVGATLMDLVVFVATFVEYGTTSRAARWFGAGEPRAAVNEGVQASWIAAAAGLGVVVVSEIFADPMTRLLAGTDGSVQHAAAGWFRIAVLGMPAALLVLAGNGWMRGVQRTRTPVIIVLVANGISAAASPILVYPLRLGLDGSAIANVCAQSIGAVWFIWSLRQTAHSTPGWWRPQWAIIRAQLLLGRDLTVRSAAFQVLFLTGAGVAARMGTAQLAAHQIAIQLWSFSAFVLDSFAIAAQSLVGAALGGHDAVAARRFAWQTARYGLVAGVAFGVVLAACWVALPLAFTSSASVRTQLHHLWPWFVGMQPFAGVVFALDGVLIGAGDVAFLRTITLVGVLAAFVPLNLAALHWQWGIGGVWAGLVGFILVRFVGMLARIRGVRWAVVGVAP
jgi:putative MATE family efflux protein